LSRFDKYDPVSGGFRAPLEDAIAAADVGKVFGVSLNANGRVQRDSAAVADVTGVIIANHPMAAGDITDVMTDGEIVEFTTTAGAASTAGTRYYAAAADGAVSTTNTGKLIGKTVEVGRLIVRVVQA
jgi:hypothetical protein